MTREICKICFNENPIGFDVPNEVWNAVTTKEWGDKVVCINCFTKLADQKLVEWDKNIFLYPVSRVTLKMVNK